MTDTQKIWAKALGQSLMVRYFLATEDSELNKCTESLDYSERAIINRLKDMDTDLEEILDFLDGYIEETDFSYCLVSIGSGNNERRAVLDSLKEVW